MRFETVWLKPAAALPLLALPLLLVGCTPMEWVKPDATPEERDRDSIACQQAAWQEARMRAWYYRPLAMAPFRDGSGRRRA